MGEKRKCSHGKFCNRREGDRLWQCECCGRWWHATCSGGTDELDTYCDACFVVWDRLLDSLLRSTP